MSDFEATISSYPKVYNLGHKAIADLFDGPVIVQEKIDGSQISFCWVEGDLHVKSKGSWQYGGPDGRVEPDGMFQPAVNHLLSVDVPACFTSYVFRGETLATPKHNTIAYDRVPNGHIVLFDVHDDGWNRLNTSDRYDIAEKLGVDAVGEHRIGGEKVTMDYIKHMLDNAWSMLANTRDPRPEGFVFKTFERFGVDGKPLMGKYVRPEFKEKHTRQWKGKHPSQGDVVQAIIESLNTEQRFEKAVQHLRDDGNLEGSPKDIGALMKEIKRDVIDEEQDWIKDKLYEAFGDQIRRGIGRGLPEWYKERLAEEQFA